jgi:CubicO group peptidase (beta-lactamase class C family)
MHRNLARRGRRNAARGLIQSVAAALVLTATMVVLTGTTATADETLGGGDTVDIAAVDRFLTRQLDAAHIPGAAIAITHDDQVVHVAGFGHDSTGAPVTADTPFRIASLTKSFTALAVMQLVDDGRLSLDDRVVDHLPRFHLADPRSADITIRQLLNQTSGMADSEIRGVGRHDPATLAEAVADLRDNGLAAAPGTQWNYHNPNFQVAARVVGVVTAQPFARYLHTHVLEPAGMTSSRTVDADNKAPGLADGHIVAYGHPFALPAPGTFDGGEGDVVSTAADMANWLVVQATDGRAPDGTRIISSRSLTRMHTPNGNGTAHGYALGWDTDGPGHVTRYEHTGNVLTYTAYQVVLPETGYGVAVLLNSGSGLMLDETGIFHGVRDIIDGTDATPAGPAEAPYSAGTIDAILAILTLAVLLLGVRGVLRARRWAARRGQDRAQLVLRSIPLLAVLATVALYPRLAGQLVGGRTVTWETAAYGSAALTAFVLTLLVATVATLTARGWQLAQRMRAASTTTGSLTGRIDGAGSDRVRSDVGQAARANQSIARSATASGASSVMKCAASST